MSIDNDGEGGILSLMALLGGKERRRPVMVVAGLLGAVLSLVPRAAFDSAGVPGDRRHYYRQPVDHNGRIFDDPPSYSAWLASAALHQADLGKGLRPDLCRRSKLAADGRHCRADCLFPQV